MKQIIIKTWKECKEKYPDTVILVRYFDFYYTLNEDAYKLQPCGCCVYRDTEHDGFEYASFIHHALDTMLQRLIRQGNRVGITDILTKPNT